MEWTDVCVGPMSAKGIGKEIEHYLNSYKKPSQLKISIERLKNGKFYTKIYMLVSDFIKEIGDEKEKEMQH